MWHGIIRGHVRRAAMLVALTVGLSGGAPAQEAGDAAAPPEYRLTAGDKVRVVVFGHDDLSGEFELDGAGRLSLPLIRVVDAAGLSTSDLERAITDALQPDYLRNPRVSVEILGYRPVYIIGEVREPGSYPFTSGMTVVNAVAMAGGYTYRAARNKMTVTRANEPDAGKTRIAEDTRVYPGDVIEVPERFF